MIADSDKAALSTVTGFLLEQLATIDNEQWTRATPCSDWDLRSLVDHVVGGNWFTLAILGGATSDDSLRRAREQFAGGSPTARQAALSVSEQFEAFQTPGVLGRIWHHVAGDLTGREILRLRLHDLIVHGWDISQSLQSAAELPSELAMWGLADISAEGSLAIQHFALDPSQLSRTEPSTMAYVRLFDRDAWPNW